MYEGLYEVVGAQLHTSLDNLFFFQEGSAFVHIMDHDLEGAISISLGLSHRCRTILCDEWTILPGAILCVFFFLFCGAVGPYTHVLFGGLLFGMSECIQSGLVFGLTCDSCCQCHQTAMPMCKHLWGK